MATILQLASSYLDAGLSVIPIRIDGSKAAAVEWKRFQEQRPEASDLQGWYVNGHYGIALVCGVGSRNVEVIDFDSPGLIEQFGPLVELQSPGLMQRLTLIQTPSGGHHLVYRCMTISGNQKLAQRSGPDGRPKTVIETRGQGGYVLTVGSPAACHPSGKTYDHIAGPSLTDLTHISPDERDLLFAAAMTFNQLADEPDTEPRGIGTSDGTFPGDHFNRDATWEQILEPHDWRKVCCHGEKTIWRRPNKESGWSATTGLRSVRGNELLCIFSSNAWPFNIPAGKKCTNHTKFGTYAILNHGGDYKAAARQVALDGYCETIYTSIEVVTTAAAQPIETPQPVAQPRQSVTINFDIGPPSQFGVRLIKATVADVEVHRDKFDPDDAARIERFAGAVAKITCPQPSAVIVRGIADALKQQMRQIDGDNDVNYQILNAAELDAGDFHIPYLIPGILPAMQPGGIFGEQKSLKTSIALALNFSLATGTPFLGYWHCPEAMPVLMMTGESGLATNQETLRRIASAGGYSLGFVPNLFISPDIPRFGSHRHLEALRAAIVIRGIKVLTIDPMYLAMGAGVDPANMFAVGELLKEVSVLCQSTGTTLILLHHTKKGVGDRRHESRELGDIAWAGTAEFVRWWVMLSRREVYEPGSGLHRLTASVGGSAGHSGKWGIDIDEGEFQHGVERLWNVLVMKSTELQKSAENFNQRNKERSEIERLEMIKTKLLRAMQELPNGGTERDIRDRANVNGAKAGPAFQSLLSEKLIEECLVKKSNHKKPYIGYKLCD